MRSQHWLQLHEKPCWEQTWADLDQAVVLNEDGVTR